MNITHGWRFFSADFSVQANRGDDDVYGHVMLMREPTDRFRWHQMPEDAKAADDGPPLYVVGRGLTLEDAVHAANAAALRAKPIPEV